MYEPYGGLQTCLNYFLRSLTGPGQRLYKNRSWLSPYFLSVVIFVKIHLGGAKASDVYHLLMFDLCLSVRVPLF
uniref:Uncharacterized protein n=1 Tax=Anguilla anguilla TaxID=7936 RepID=A0A0E9RRN0_ANGAN